MAPWRSGWERRVARSARSFDPDELERRLVWLLGSPRSGSSWLVAQLAELPGVSTILEPLVGRHLALTATAPVAGRTGYFLHNELLADQENYLFSHAYESAWRPLFREAILGRFAAQLAAHGRPAGPVVVKEPNGSAAAGPIFELMPRSRLLFLIRDGRDVVDSFVDALSHPDWILAYAPGQRALEQSKRMEFIEVQSALWRFYTEAVDGACRDLDDDACFRVRYEDLLADTERWLARIAEWLGAAAPPERIAAVARRHSFAELSEEQRGPGKFARAASPGAWRENMTAAEQRLMQEMLGDTLARLGYD